MNFGYDSSTANQDGFEDEYQTESNHIRVGDYDTLRYKVKKKYKLRTWIGEVDGEEVEFQWVQFKYGIYRIAHKTRGGDWIDETSTIDQIIVLDFIVRDKTLEELYDSGLVDYDDELGEYVSKDGSSRCSDQHDKKKCCSACQKYVKKVVAAAADISDQSYKAYTPYIARVVGSWFRNTYFVIPKNKDKAITDYAKKDYHTEFNAKEAYGNTVEFVDVNQDYLADSGEYWTAYEMKIDPNTNKETNEYQLFFLNPDGTTSDTKMEDFLTSHGYEPNDVGQKAAEDDGWAFVKKANMTNIDDFANDSYVMNKNDNGIDTSKILWSAYVFDGNGTTSNWQRVTYSDNNDKVNEVYRIMYHTNEEGEGGEHMDMEKANSDSEPSGYFYEIQQSNSVTQEEDAQRGPTNPLVKYLFKYRQYYIYDGTDKTALAIAHDKYRVLHGYENYIHSGNDNKKEFYTDKVFVPEVYKDIETTGYSDISNDGNFYHYKGLLGSESLLATYYGSNWKSDVVALLNKYGRSALRETYGAGTLSMSISENDLAEQWLEWQLDMFYMDKYGLDLYEYYNTTTSEVREKGGTDTLLFLKVDPRDPDLVSTVSIEKSSLSSFAILENTGTIDAEYQYRDFKELIVELNYFDKEDLSEKNPEIFTWILPETPVAANWPILPVDKQDVEYGTLIHSHQAYVDLGIEFNTGGTSSGTSVDANQVYWIGDSWTVGLVEHGLLNGTIDTSGGLEQVINDRILAKVGASAYSLPGTPNPPSDTSGIVVALGKNDPFDAGINAITSLVDSLTSSNPDTPIYVLKLSYYGVDPYVDSGQTITKSTVDSFNQAMQSYCSGKDKVTFLDPTGAINGSGVIKTEYNLSDNIHLNKEGYTAWYNDIIAGLKGNAGSNPQNGGSQPQSQRTASGVDFGVQSLDEHASDNSEHAAHIVTSNGIEYLQFGQSGYYGSLKVYGGNEEYHIRTDGQNQTLSGMGCGIYSTTSLLSAYVEDVSPEKTVKWMHDNIGTSSFNNNGNRTTSMDKMLDDNGVTGEWYSSNIQQVLSEAFSAGKPIIANIAPGSQHWTTSGGHFLCFTGISQDGTIYSADSVSGGGDRLEYKAASDFNGAVSALASMLSFNAGVWVPDQAPTGVRRSGGNNGGEVAQFQGYEADQFVASPVTGRIIEYGTHKRTNIYTLEEEIVGYVKIEAMSSDYFDDSMMSSEIMDAYESKIEDDDLKAKYGTPATGLNLFYKEYENVCAGFQVMIDGFKVDLSLDQDSGVQGQYTQNKVKTLYNTKEEKKRNAMEQAKDDAPFFVNYGVNETSHPLIVDDNDYELSALGSDSEKVYYRYNEDTDGLKAYYVKEGKYIGKTITSEATYTPDPGTPTPEDPEPETPTPSLPDPNDPDPSTPDPNDPDNEAQVNANGDEIPDHPDYMRIIIQNLDYSQVENVERYFYRPSGTSQGGALGNVSQEYQAWPRDLECLAECMVHEASYNHCMTKSAHGDEEGEFNAYCCVYSIVNKVLEENSGGYGHLYDKSYTAMSPLVQVMTNSYGGVYHTSGSHYWYYHGTAEAVLKVYNGSSSHDYTDDELRMAEYALTYDCTSVIKPYDTVLSQQALGDGYYKTPVGTPIPRCMCQQGGYGDGAAGQSHIILVGYTDQYQTQQFDHNGLPLHNGYNGDELFGIDWSMRDQIPASTGYIQ